jgi:hypothetical protein
MEGKQRITSYGATFKRKVIVYAEKYMVTGRREGSSM